MRGSGGRHAEEARLLARAQAEPQDVDWSGDDFDATLAADVEVGVRRALGAEPYAAPIAAGKLLHPARQSANRDHPAVSEL